MRIAPVGLLAPRDRAFSLGVEVAALTHGHPSGYLAAGFLAALIAAIRDGEPLGTALDGATVELERHQGAEETVAAISVARRLVDAGAPSAERVESSRRRLGGGRGFGDCALRRARDGLLRRRGGACRQSRGRLGLDGRDRRQPRRDHLRRAGDPGRVAGERWNCATRSHSSPRICTEPQRDVAQWDPEREWDRYPGW